VKLSRRRSRRRGLSSHRHATGCPHRGSRPCRPVHRGLCRPHPQGDQAGQGQLLGDSARDLARAAAGDRAQDPFMTAKCRFCRTRSLQPRAGRTGAESEGRRQAVFKLMPSCQGGFHAHRQRDRARQIADSSLESRRSGRRKAGDPGDLRPQGAAAACAAVPLASTRCSRCVENQHPGARGNGRNQREYVLRQQLKPSRRSWARSTRQAGLGRLPGEDLGSQDAGETEKVALKQLERLKVMQPSSLSTR